MTAAVRSCMESRFRSFDTSKLPSTLLTSKGAIKDPLETILELTDLMNLHEGEQENQDLTTLIGSQIRNPESVLQELDIQRLRAIIYRDVVRQDRSKSGKNVVVVVVIDILFCFHCSLFAPLKISTDNDIFLFIFRMIQNNHNF